MRQALEHGCGKPNASIVFFQLLRLPLFFPLAPRSKSPRLASQQATPTCPPLTYMSPPTLERLSNVGRVHTAPLSRPAWDAWLVLACNRFPSRTCVVQHTCGCESREKRADTRVCGCVCMCACVRVCVYVCVCVRVCVCV